MSNHSGAFRSHEMGKKNMIMMQLIPSWQPIFGAEVNFKSLWSNYHQALSTPLQFCFNFTLDSLKSLPFPQHFLQLSVKPTKTRLLWKEFHDYLQLWRQHSLCHNSKKETSFPINKNKNWFVPLSFPSWDLWKINFPAVSCEITTCQKYSRAAWMLCFSVEKSW